MMFNATLALHSGVTPGSTLRYLGLILRVRAQARKVPPYLLYYISPALGQEILEGLKNNICVFLNANKENFAPKLIYLVNRDDKNKDNMPD